MDPKVAPARTALTAVALLATFTYYSTINAGLPPTGYLTFTDLFCVAAIFGSLISVFAFIRVHYLLTLHDEQPKPLGNEPIVDYKRRAQEQDIACRIFFPIYIVLSFLCCAIPVIIRSMTPVYDDG